MTPPNTPPLLTASAALLQELGACVGSAHVLATGDLSAWERDQRGRRQGKALAVVRPGSSAEVATVVRACVRAGVALVPQGEWGNRVLAAFQQSWQAAGGNLIAAEHVDQPVELAQQIADLLQLRQSEARAKRLQSTLGTPLAALPARGDGGQAGDGDADHHDQNDQRIATNPADDGRHGRHRLITLHLRNHHPFLAEHRQWCIGHDGIAACIVHLLHHPGHTGYAGRHPIGAADRTPQPVRGAAVP